MKIKFKNKQLEQFYSTPLTEITGKLPISKDIIKQYKKKIQILLSAENTEELKQFRSLNFEALQGERKGEFSIRLNIQYRLIFNIEKEESGEYTIDIILIKEISKHYE